MGSFILKANQMAPWLDGGLVSFPQLRRLWLANPAEAVVSDLNWLLELKRRRGSKQKLNPDKMEVMLLVKTNILRKTDFFQLLMKFVDQVEILVCVWTQFCYRESASVMMPVWKTVSCAKAIFLSRLSFLDLAKPIKTSVTSRLNYCNRVQHTILQSIKKWWWADSC